MYAKRLCLLERHVPREDELRGWISHSVGRGVPLHDASRDRGEVEQAARHEIDDCGQMMARVGVACMKVDTGRVEIGQGKSDILVVDADRRARPTGRERAECLAQSFGVAARVHSDGVASRPDRLYVEVGAELLCDPEPNGVIVEIGDLQEAERLCAGQRV